MYASLSTHCVVGELNDVFILHLCECQAEDLLLITCVCMLSVSAGTCRGLLVP